RAAPHHRVLPDDPAGARRLGARARRLHLRRHRPPRRHVREHVHRRRCRRCLALRRPRPCARRLARRSACPARRPARRVHAGSGPHGRRRPRGDPPGAGAGWPPDSRLARAHGNVRARDPPPQPARLLPHTTRHRRPRHLRPRRRRRATARARSPARRERWSDERSRAHLSQPTHGQRANRPPIQETTPMTGKREWEDRTYKPFVGKSPERDVRFESLSGIPVQPLYTPEDVADKSYDERLGYPGQYPFTRGVYPTMYRGRLWTMRMFAGFGRPEDTNARFKYLLEQGQTGLSTAFDMPALMGYDADHPRARGEVGREGVSVSTLADFEILFRDIPLDKVTTSMTINCTASVALAMYLALADKQGVGWDRIGGTMQNDMLKEFIAQKEWISPPESAVRVDTIEFCARHVPRFNPVSISGYHIREAGSTAVQELAFTLADGFGYVQA